MSDRKHVLLGYGPASPEHPLAWCGVEPGAWAFTFTSATHALLSLRNGQDARPCKACLKAMRAIIDAEVGT